MEERLQECVKYFNWLLPDLLGARCWVAGGALREYFAREAPKSDIDLFFSNESAAKETAEALEKLGARKTFENERIINFLHKKRLVQCVLTKHYTSPQETVDSFDFTVCCAAVDHESVYHHPAFFMDLSRRALAIQSLPYPLSTLQRLQRYVQKGYVICNGGLLTLAKAIGELDLNEADSNHLEFYPDGQPRFLRID